jgi:hypothetical protein
VADAAEEFELFDDKRCAIQTGVYGVGLHGSQLISINRWDMISGKYQIPIRIQRFFIQQFIQGIKLFFISKALRKRNSSISARLVGIFNWLFGI